METRKKQHKTIIYIIYGRDNITQIQSVINPFLQIFVFLFIMTIYYVNNIMSTKASIVEKMLKNSCKING